MSLKNRLAGKSKNVADVVAASHAEDAAPRPPVTMPGQLAAFTKESAGLREENDKLKEALGKADFRNVPLTDIHEVAGRKRSLSPQEFAELKSNLSHNPLFTPITLRETIRGQSGHYEVIAGHNRLQAYRELGRTEILAVVVDYDEQLADLGAFYSNLLAPALPDYERYLGFSRIQQKTGFSESQMADEAGVERTQVSRLLKFAALPQEALDLISQRPSCIGASAVSKLVDLHRAGRTDAVVDAITRLVTDPTYTQAQAIAAAAASPVRKQAPPEKTTIRSGRLKFCEVRRRDGAVTIKFENADIAEQAWLKLEAALRAAAAEI